jgi:hypothetical protein
MAGRVSYYGGIVRNGLVLHLDAAKKDSYPGSGTLWRDLSGNGNNGTLISGSTWNNLNGGGIVLNGTTQYISINSNTPGTLISTTDATISSFFKIKSLPFCLYAGNADSSNVQYYGLIGSGGNSNIYTRPTTSINAQLITATYNFSATQIINLTITTTYNGSNTIVTYYVNGSSVGTTTFSGGGNLYLRNIGGFISPFSSPSFFPNIDLYDMKVYNRILTQSEITQNYNALKGRYGL